MTRQWHAKTKRGLPVLRIVLVLIWKGDEKLWAWRSRVAASETLAVSNLSMHDGATHLVVSCAHTSNKYEPAEDMVSDAVPKWGGIKV